MSRYRSMRSAGSDRRRSRGDSSTRNTGEAEAPRPRVIEPATPEEMAAATLTPLRDEVVRTEELGVDADRRFRRDLDELLEDISGGLTPHICGRAKATLDPGLEEWFTRREEATKVKNNELQSVIETMGKALKTIQGDDEDFMGGLEQSLSRLHKTADSVQVRHVSARLNQLLEATAEQAQAEREMRDKKMRSLSSMVRGLHEQLDQARVKMAEDELTGLYNRRSFDQRLEAEIEKCRLSPYSFAVIMIDLDKFKSVNDTFGHVGGDRVLQACAEAIKAIVMRTDDFAARYGGEEMVIILADCTMEHGRKVAEAVRQRLERMDIQTGTAIHRQTASFGVAEGCEEDQPVDVIERADAALYAAKETGRNKVVVAGIEPARRVRLPANQARRLRAAKKSA